MKRAAIIIASFILILLLGSCGGSKYEERLSLLDSIVGVQPDSVYHLLCDMEQEVSRESKSTRMRYELLKADAQNKAYIDFTTDSVMKVVADYYDRHGSANEKMRAFYLLGCTYRDLQDAPMQLQCFLEATEKADTTRQDCDLNILAAIYGQMANLYHDQYLPEEELKAWKMCQRIAELDNDTLSAISAYQLQARAYYFMNMPDSVLSITEKARARYLEIGETKKAARLLSSSIGILLDRKEYDKAHRYIKIFRNESGYFSGNEITSSKAYVFYHSLGRYALAMNQLDSAKHYFYKLSTHGQKEAAYQGLQSVYEREGKIDSIVKYSRLYALANDSSHFGKNSQTIAQMGAIYNYSQEKLHAENAQKELLAGRQKISVLLMVMACMIFCVMIGAYKVKKKHRKTIDKINTLNQEINFKTLELAEAETNNNKHFEQIQTLLEETQGELAKYKAKDTLTAFYRNDTFLLFKKASTNRHYKIGSKEWEAMYILFHTTFSSFTSFINSGKPMTGDQIKVSMLIRIGFAESEMANILDVDSQRINRIKIQINQKLFDASNASTLVENLKEHF